MRVLLLLFPVVALVPGALSRVYDDSPFLYDTFPDGFMWGSATSSYQIEGGWNEGGKGESIWDTFCRKPGVIRDGTDGTIACDSYHKYKDDVQIIKDMKAHSYRFSIAWPRLFPNGIGTEPVAEGVAYYNNLINELLANNIQPLITLYHWDLPQALEDHGGWLNESAVVEPFANYSRKCFELFGDRVKFWITFNEPWVVAFLGYGSGSKAPGLKGYGNNSYIVAHSILKAHAQAYHIYNNEFRSTQQGQIGITLNVGWAEPVNNESRTDLEAQERAMAWDLGWFANPIFGSGDYPQVMKDRIANNSQEQGFSQSRLPAFTQDEINYIHNTSDFFGLNFYGGGLVESNENPDITVPSFDSDKAVIGSGDPDWIRSGSSWLAVTPWSMRRVLNWIRTKYNNPSVFVTENGVSDKNGTVDDDHRVYYIREYVNSMLKAIKHDHCKVIGYTAWSLMDNFEWEAGYDEKFGMHYVNFSDPSRTRIPKASARYYAQLITDNGFPAPATTQPPTSATTPENGASCLALSFSVLGALFLLLPLQLLWRM